MKILLTGGNGFLGKALQAHWGKHELTVIGGRSGFAEKLAAAPDVDWVVHAGFEVVFRRDAAAEARNRASTDALLRYFGAGKGQRLLFLSGAGALGVSDVPSEREETQLGITDAGFEAYRDTAYILGKIEAEQSFRAAKIPLTVLYLTTVYGPGMPAETAAGALHGKLAPPGGTSFLGLTDFLRAIDLALAAPAENESYVVNGGNVLFADLFAAARGKRNFILLPNFTRWLFRLAQVLGGNSFLSFAVMESAFGFKYYSPAKFTRRFGWQAETGVSGLFANQGGKHGA